MALTSMPDGWVLDSGTLGVDFDESQTFYLTGFRSMAFIPTSTLTRLLSAPIPCSETAFPSVVRSKIGWSLAFTATNAAATATAGVWYYDVNGNFLSSDTVTVSPFIAFNWYTDGAISDIPSGATSCRIGLEYQSSVFAFYVAYMTPYLMPPFGHLDLTAPVATVPGGSATISFSPLATGAPGGSWGTHAIQSALDVFVRETGDYKVSAWVELDDYSTSDVFSLSIIATAGNARGQKFFPTIAKGSLSIIGATADLSIACNIPLAANEGVRLVINQHAGSSRNVTDAELRISKES